MVAAFHLIWTAYGWWLPNDPRGSTSHEIRVEKIADLGELHYERKPIQPSNREIRQFFQQARDVLKHPLRTLEDEDIDLVGQCLAQVIKERSYTCYACAIMPDHVHVLIRKHRDHAETMIENLQKASRDTLLYAGRRAPTHPVWGGPGWKVFLVLVGAARQCRGPPSQIGRPPVAGLLAPPGPLLVTEAGGVCP